MKNNDRMLGIYKGFKMNFRQSLIGFFAITFLMSNLAHAADVKLEYIGEKIIPWHQKFKDTIIGGLSGIDYDAKTDRYVVISDDRGSQGTPRFYGVSLEFNLKSFEEVKFTDVGFLLGSHNKKFKKPSLLGTSIVDPESIRFSKDGKSYYWTSEGNAKVGVNPAIFQMTLGGKFLSKFNIPKDYLVAKDKKSGVRNNGAFEAMALSASGKELIVMTEVPLIQDGPEATFEQGGIVRIALYDVTSKNRVKEFTYEIDPVHKRTLPIKKFSINGAVEIVNITGDRYIVMERSFSVGHMNDIRLYEIDLSEVKNRNSKGPVEKKLLLNLENVDVFVDNIEGMTFGKNFKDGRRSLILVSDDNFRGSQKTQFLVFAVSGLF